MAKPTKLDGVALFLMGGTIDSRWCPKSDTAVPNRHSVMCDFIRDFITPDYKIYEEFVTRKDRRNITEEVRASLIQDIINLNHKNIIVTHGTFTMADTARRVLQEFKTNPSMADKRIVFTGSFVPIEGFAKSDGQANLGFCLAALSFMKPGVMVAMNGQLFEPEQCDKHIHDARFIDRRLNKEEQEAIDKNIIACILRDNISLAIAQRHFSETDTSAIRNKLLKMGASDLAKIFDLEKLISKSGGG